MPAGLAGFRMTATRVTLGAICLRSSNHFPLKLYSNSIKPVALLPGRASASTKPAPTGSTTPTKTIGKLRVTCCNAVTLREPAARMISGASAISSLRVSAFALDIVPHPSGCRSARCGHRSSPIVGVLVETPRGRPDLLDRPRPGSLAGTPIRRIGSGCCARAPSGTSDRRAAGSVMNSRRFTSEPRSANGILAFQMSTSIGAETGIKTIAAVHSKCRSWVIHDRCIQYPCRSMSVVTPIATLLFGAAK